MRKGMLEWRALKINIVLRVDALFYEHIILS